MSARHRCAMVGAGRRSAIVRSRLVVAIAGSFAAASTPAQVTPERLLNAADEPANWLNYSATYDNQRYSALDEITRENVGELELQWIWQARSLEKFEATPLVVDGVVYTVQAPNDIVALDAATGRVFWTYHHENDPGVPKVAQHAGRLGVRAKAQGREQGLAQRVVRQRRAAERLAQHRGAGVAQPVQPGGVRRDVVVLAVVGHLGAQRRAGPLARDRQQLRQSPVRVLEMDEGPEGVEGDQAADGDAGSRCRRSRHGHATQCHVAKMPL